MPPVWMTLLWMAALLLVAALPLAVALRAGRIPAAPGTPPQKPRYDPETARRAAQNLSASVRFQTVSHPEVTRRDYGQWLALRKYLKESYPLCARHLSLEMVGGFSLVYKWASPAPRGDPLLFCGHLDVVPAAGQWTFPPFGGDIEDGYVHGRGTLDCKNVVICLMETVEGLLTEGFLPSRDIWLAFGHDEEIGGAEGAKNIARLFAQRGLRFSLVLDEGGALASSTLPVGRPVAEIGVAEKGFMNVRLTARGQGGHASRPPDHTALGVLAEALCRIEWKSRPARLTPLIRDNLLDLAPWLPYKDRMRLASLGLFRRGLLRRLCRHPHTAALVRTTIAATMASCGTAPNVLPQQAEAVLNIRPVHGDGESGVLTYLRALTSDLGVEIEVLRSEPPSRVSDYKGAMFGHLRAAVEEIFPGAPVAVGLVCGGTDARNYEPFSDCVLRFSPFILTEEDEASIHGDNERVAVASLGAAAAFYRALLLRAAPALPEGTAPPPPDREPGPETAPPHLPALLDPPPSPRGKPGRPRKRPPPEPSPSGPASSAPRPEPGSSSPPAEGDSAPGGPSPQAGLPHDPKEDSDG